MEESTLLPRRRRLQLYGVLCVGLFSLAVLVGLRREKFNVIHSDGRFYYVYLPSLIIDGDLDFENQVREHWDPNLLAGVLPDRTQTGLLRNKLPIGFAITLLPAFLLAHAFALASGGLIPADGYSWIYQGACLAWIVFLLWRFLCQIDRIMTTTLSIPPGPTLLGVMVLICSTPVSYYSFRDPFMAHVVSMCWCTEVAAAACRAPLRASRFWPRMSFAAAMAVVCRPSNAFMFPVIVFGIVRLVRQEGWRRSFAWLPLGAVGLVPIGLQMLTWKALEGQWVTYTFRDEVFEFWDRPKLWQTLFSSRHGLYFYSPILFLATVALARRFRESLVFCWGLGALVLWYVNSSWYSWWFADAYGARAFIELSGLFAVGLGFFFASLWRYPRAVAAIAVVSVSYNLFLMVLFVKGRIPASDYWLSW